MLLVERNGSNPSSLSALENTLFSVQMVFGWKSLVGGGGVWEGQDILLLCMSHMRRF